jgi:diguanylate cyclase (GGDEF)-like protein/PAS domain S-box-containing protein
MSHDTLGTVLSDLERDHIETIFAPFENAHIGVACLDMSGHCVIANAHFCRILRSDLNSVIGASLAGICAKEHLDGTIQRIRSLFRGHIKSYHIKRELNRLDGSTLTATLSVSPVSHHGRNIAALIVMTEVMPEASSPQNELKKLSLAVKNSGSAVLLVDSLGVIEYCNPHFCSVSGYALDDLMGRHLSTLMPDADDPNLSDALWRSLLAGETWRGALQIHRKDNTKYWSYQSLSPILDETGSLTSIVMVSEDISSFKEQEQHMLQLAYFDPLTGLGNRRHFRDTLDNLIHLSDRCNSAVLLLDMDHFKQVNDTLGHDVGDDLLTCFAKRLLSCMPSSGSVYRLGGDEFTILLKDTSEDTVEALAQTIIDTIAQPIHIDQHEITITVSIGYAMINSDGKDSSAILKHADLAMYAAKRMGRNTFSHYLPTMDLAIKRAMTLEQDLRHALSRHQLELYYQPVVDMENGRIRSVEALCRWRHPTEGHIPPSEFIDNAETTGIIVPLGEWVIQQACITACQLRTLGLDIHVSVNISPKQLHHPQLFEHIQGALMDTQCRPEWITLELSEASVLEEDQPIQTLLNALKQLGIGLSIDDFGIGFSSLIHLKRKPLSSIKISRGFTQHLMKDDASHAITETMISMVRHLNMTPIAEGIETEEQRRFYLSRGCLLGQGYLYAPPLALSALMKALKHNKGVFRAEYAQDDAAKAG